MRKRFRPVVIWEEPGKRREIKSIEQAAEWLAYRWPADYVAAPDSQAARLEILAVLEGKGSVNVARVAFVDAAEEAGILVEA